MESLDMYADNPTDSKEGPVPQNSGGGEPLSHWAPAERSTSSTPSFKTQEPLNEDEWAA